jgi:O-antigen/teichoic acid export membrane protein
VSTPVRTLTPDPSPVMGEGGRLRRWVRILAAYFSTQTLTQLAGIAAGLLLINFMPVREFALYTLGLSVINFFIFVSDLGSTTSLLHFYHRAARGEEDFRPYLAAVLSLRRAAFWIGAAGVAAMFPRAAAAKGYGAREIALSAAGILLCVAFQIPSSLRLLDLRLADRYGRSYRAELAGSGVRLLWAMGMIAASWLVAWAGILASALAAATVAFMARPAAPPEPLAVDLAPYRRRVLRYLLPTLPSALYFAVQGPLTVWLATTFGSTRNMAEVGALSRLGMVVGLFSTLIGVVFLPRLARVTDDRVYLVRYLQFGAALAAVALALLAAAAAVPRLFLLLLGGSYAGLHRELLLVVGGSGVTLLGGYIVNVNLARSWTRWQGGTLAIEIAVLALLTRVLPLSTTAGVLTLSLLSTATGVVLQMAIAFLGFRHPGRVEWKA